jgi:uncharacterized protein (TIGR03437 family)
VSFRSLILLFGLPLFGQTIISTYAGGGLPPSPIAAAKASISPVGLAFDSAGNLYFSSNQCIFKLDANGIVTRIAGDSRPGYSGDGGPAANAELNNPDGVAFDASGNLYIAGGNRIRKITPAGIISTVAGNGTESSTGDGGPASSATVAAPFGIAVDRSGNVYFSQLYVSTVRRISTSGIITTVAGNGLAGFGGDGGSATAAQLHQPLGLTVDSSGNLYIADNLNSRVRKVSASGTITTVAGNGMCCQAPSDGTPATQAELGYPVSVAVDASGTLYFADAKVRRVSSTGILTTIGGQGTAPPGTDGAAVNVSLAIPSVGLVFDGRGNLFIAVWGEGRIRTISPTGTITTAVGNGTRNYSGDGGPASVAQMGQPGGLLFDAAGNLYVADLGNPVVRKISPAGIVSVVAGNGTSGFSGDGGPATSAQLALSGFSFSMAMDGAGNLYLADSVNRRIRKVASNGIITTIAGGGTGGDGGPATKAQILWPSAIAVDANGTVYFADLDQIRKVTSSGIISTIAGGSDPGYFGDNGPAVRAALNAPSGLAVAANGDLYIADTGNSSIRKITPDGIISTVVGGMQANTPPCKAQTALALGSLLGSPKDMTFDAAGNLFVSNTGAACVERVSPAGIVTIVAGTGTPGYSGDGGPPTAAQLLFPGGIAIDKKGNIFIADSFAGVIRVIQPAPAPIVIQSVANAASNLPGPVSPGEIVTITGTGIGPAQLVSATAGSNGLFGTQLADTTVLFDGIPAPIIYASAMQTAAIVPYGIAGQSTQVTITYQGRTSGAYSSAVAAAAPGIFTANSSGIGPAAALNQDGSLNSSSSPASLGDVIVLFATGEGQTTPSGIDGKLAATPLPQPNLPVVVTIGGQAAQILYAGGAPGEVAGLIQINAKIPNSIQPGSAAPVILRVGGVAAPVGVTISVR